MFNANRHMLFKYIIQRKIFSKYLSLSAVVLCVVSFKINKYRFTVCRKDKQWEAHDIPVKPQLRYT